MATFTPIAGQLNYRLPDPIGVDQLKRRNALADRDQAVQEQNAASYQNSLAVQQEGQKRNWLARDEASREQAVGRVGSLAQQALASGNPRAFAAQAIAHPEYQRIFQDAGIDPRQINLDSPEFDQHLQMLASLGPQSKQADEFTLTPGQSRYRGNQLIASVPTAPTEITPYQREDLKLRREQLNKADKGPGAPSGYRYNAQGALEAIPGGPADKQAAPKPPTEGDKKASVLFGSMVNAEKQLAKLTGPDTSNVTQMALGSNPFTRPLQSDDFKKYESAGLRWAANLLYSKSGATATPDEIRSTWKQYFPQVGEGPEVVAQKLEARTQEMQTVAQTYGLDASQIPKPKAPATVNQGVAKPVTATGPNGQKIMLQNGKWVPFSG